MTTQTATPYQRPWMYAKQEAAMFTEKRYAIIEASSKSGKTVSAMAWLLKQATLHGEPNRNYWWLARSYSQAKIAYRRFKTGLPRGSFSANESDLTLTLENGAVLWFKTGDDPDNLYGEDVFAAVIDEASRVKRGAWVALRTTVSATQGPIRIIGNVVGSRNWAYDLARRAEAGEPNMHYAKITAYDAIEAGILPAEEVEDARRMLSEGEFKELYLAEPAESLSLIYANFGPENVTEDAEYVPHAGEIYLSFDHGFSDGSAITFCQLRDGVLFQWDELWGHGKVEAEWVQEIVRKLVALPDYIGPSYDDWETIWARALSPLRWPDVWPVVAAGDPSDVQFRAELKRRGIGAARAGRITHHVEIGQDVLRSVIRSGTGEQRYRVHPRCKNTIESLQNYRANELEDGAYEGRPSTDAANHRWSHATDSLRYLVWLLRKRFGLRTVGEDVL